jgi:putative addiction module component (TIGR02574 family)
VLRTPLAERAEHIRRTDMSETAQKLLEQIRALPADEREWLVGELWDESEVTDDETDELENDPEFQAMLAERLEQVEKHPEKLLTWEEAQQRIDAELGRRRAARGET